jgi:hypothetical protein
VKYLRQFNWKNPCPACKQETLNCGSISTFHEKAYFARCENLTCAASAHGWLKISGHLSPTNGFTQALAALPKPPDPAREYFHQEMGL